MQLETATTTAPPPPAGRVGMLRPSAFTFKLALIALGGFGARLAYVLVGGAKDASYDGFYYYVVANALVDGDGYVNPFNGVPTALHPPAWPVLLGVPSVVGLDSLLSHQVFAAVVGTVTVVLVGLAGRVVAGGRVGLVAAAITAAYPNFWVRERELVAETLIFPLAAVVIILAYRYLRAPRIVTLLALGGACGVLVLVHSAMVILLIVLVPALTLRSQAGGSVARRLAGLAAALGVAGVVLMPWVVRNTVRFERPVLLTTNLGLTLRAANCPAAYYGDRLGSFDFDLVRPPGSVEPGGCVWNAGFSDESEVDAVFRDQAITYVQEHSNRLPVVVAAREGRTWGLFRPFQQATLERESGNGPLRVYQAAVIAYWALLPFAVAGAVSLRRRSVPLLPLLSFLVTTLVVVALSFGSVRYRAPAEVPIVVLAAVGADTLWRRLRSQDRSEPRNASTTSSASESVSSV